MRGREGRVSDLTPEQRYVYIAGPYGDAGGYLAIDKNIATARYWAARLAEARIPFFCPHLNSAHFEVITPTVPADWWVSTGLIFVEHASGLLLLPGWRDSNGTIRELSRADDLGLRIFIAESEFGKLLAWWAEEQKKR